MPSLSVLTRDLRIADNPLLSVGTGDVVPLFVHDRAISDRHHSPNREAFLAESLADLAVGMSELGTSLVYRSGPWLDTVLEVAQEAGATDIHIARDVSEFAQRRLRDLVEASHLPVVVHESITVVPPDVLAPQGGDFYQVFTPWFRRWLEHPWRTPVGPPAALASHPVASDPLPLSDPLAESVGTSPQRLRGGESEARARLMHWLPRSRTYGDTRDALGTNGTSMLSADLHFGTLSPLEVAVAALELGADAFVRQIGWRDFNHQVLFNRPQASRLDYRQGNPIWNADEQGFNAWTNGTTGYPVVDAAMRQLRATGWMHNRARMIAASLLTKDLMVDWRRGARWFMTWLTDGDVANNQLGWQWVAGTGTDTNPTRIFNPTTQSKRFDGSGTYIRAWVPELADVDTDDIHDPAPLTRAATGYPLPIVDHKEAIRSFKDARGYKR
ncbi:MAG: cryptochrome/photolyase family protein [Acidimicrobiia bacterium]